VLRAKKLTAQQVAPMWRAFYETHGPEVMARAYGWEGPECRPIRKGERVWAFFVGGHLVGWGSALMNLSDPDDSSATLVVGVFPAYQGRGIRRQIIDWMSEWAKGKGAAYASLIVFSQNEKNHARHMREALDAGPWIWAGDVWFPEEYSIFVRDLQDKEVA
jgi:GNAT superfamily N-acetyltransferase